MTEEATDLERVRYAFRLGWAIAELRGRYEPSRFDHRDPGAEKVFRRGAYQLPLSSERSPAEIRKELTETGEDLSQALGLQDDQKVAESWTTLTALLAAIESAANRKALWDEVVKSFFQWDAHVQDALVLEATHAAAYQLGRGLAETYWALEPDRSANEMGSWEFLLGPRRRELLQRLAGRLSAYLGAGVVAAIDGPLTHWSDLAKDTAARSAPGVEEDLYRQSLLWRDLIRGERQPQDLPLSPDVKTPASAEVWKDLHLYRDALSSLRLPLLGGALGIAAFILGATLLASGAGHSGFSTAVSLLGALGVTSAGLYARAKADVTSLLANLRKRVEIERVRQAADLCPVTSPDGRKQLPASSS